MRGKAAWACSARAFEAAQSPQLPRLLQQACLRAGVLCFWVALMLEHRAVAVWREQKLQRALFGRPRRAEALGHGSGRWPGHWTERLQRRLGWRAEPGIAVPAWSLPDSPRMRSLGLGRMWAVLCPFCEEFHTHSPGEGGRMPHCCGEQDRRRYRLEFAGPLPAEHRTRFYRSSKSGLPRLLHHWSHNGPASCSQSIEGPRSEAVSLLAA